MMLRDNTGTTAPTPKTPKGNINWLACWLDVTSHDIPLRCVWCEERFMADRKLQAEVKVAQLNDFSLVSAEKMLVERYMEWHIGGHLEEQQ